MPASSRNRQCKSHSLLSDPCEVTRSTTTLRHSLFHCSAPGPNAILMSDAADKRLRTGCAESSGVVPAVLTPTLGTDKRESGDMLMLERVVDIEAVRAPREFGLSETEPQSTASKYDCGICGLPAGEAVGDGVLGAGRKVCIEPVIESRCSTHENPTAESVSIVCTVPVL